MGSHIFTFICLSVGLSVDQSVCLFTLQGKSLYGEKNVHLTDGCVGAVCNMEKRSKLWKSTNEWFFFWIPEVTEEEEENFDA